MNSLQIFMLLISQFYNCDEVLKINPLCLVIVC